jgi:hypothetical protein
MKDFLLVFRSDNPVPIQLSPDEMQARLKLWMDWIGGIAAQNKLVDRGNRLSPTGKVIGQGNVVTDGPYTETKEFIGGYTIIKADSYDEAVELSKGCPIIKFNGNVEVREILPM